MKLKELREQKKISQIKLTNELNISPITYNRYENGIREPNIETLIKLADYYNVTVDYLIGRDFANDIGYLNDNEKELLSDFRELTPINQIKVVAEIKGILIAQN